MTHQLFQIPRAQPLASGVFLPGAKLNFYLTGTTTPTPVYTTSALSVAHSQPVVASAAGTFAEIYLDPSISYKATLTDSADVLQYSSDPANDSLLSAAAIAALLYPTEAGETGVVSNLYPRGHVYRYGTNTTPGTTDMTTAFQNAGLSSLKPYAPADTYKITGSTPIRSNQHWYLEGANVAITGNTQVFTATTVNDWSVWWRGMCSGDNGNAGATSGTGAAIVIIDSMRFVVVPPIAKNIKGYNLLIQPGSSTSSRAEHGLIDSLQAYACYRGIEVQAGTGAEYISIGKVNISRCATGAVIAAGNVNINGGSITDNTDNIKVTNGSNHAHGIISNVSLNHATRYLVYCDNVVNGQTFDGCHLYANSSTDGDGAIFLDQCKGIQFLGGEMDCHIYNYKGASSGINRVYGAYCPGSYGLKRLPGSNNGHDEFLIQECHGAGVISRAGDALDNAGLTMNDVSSMHVYVARAGGGGTQSLTSGVAADLIFNSEVFDRRGAYAVGTGITTIPAGQTGLYRVRGNMLFGGTAMSTTASFIEIQKNGASSGGSLFFPTINSTTKLQIPVDLDLHLTAGDTLKARATITGTTPTFGDSSSDSFLSIERIA